MKTVIEPSLDDPSLLRRRVGDCPHFGERSAGRLLDQRMMASLYCAERDSRKLIVSGRDDHGVDIGCDCVAPIGDRARSGAVRQLCSAALIAVAYHDDLMPSRRRGALSADEAAADNRETHYFLSHGSPRSAGTMRRKV
jgi:hypothetical protein